MVDEKNLGWWAEPVTRSELYRTRADFVAALLALTRGCLAMAENDRVTANNAFARTVDLLEEMVQSDIEKAPK